MLLLLGRVPVQLRQPSQKKGCVAFLSSFNCPFLLPEAYLIWNMYQSLVKIEHPLPWSGYHHAARAMLLAYMSPCQSQHAIVQAVDMTICVYRSLLWNLERQVIRLGYLKVSSSEALSCCSGERGGSICWQCWSQREEIGLQQSCRNARKCLVLQQSDLWRLMNAISTSRSVKRAKLSQ